MPALNDDLVRLNEPGFYHDDPHAVYARMRREAPVYWYDRGGFWAVTRYDDIKQVSKDTDNYSIESGMVITDVLNGVDAVNTMFPDGVELFVTKNPPRHTELRGLLNFAFSRRRVLGMQDRAATGSFHGAQERADRCRLAAAWIRRAAAHSFLFDRFS